ncbi:excinuclease ABC subunit UvrA [Rhodovulum sulfidophilum]|uniref:ATP-binding cassette domain-containing protein n=1 Tax=Rhodovulum sulfidophilum TaxID=35806 RepID=UPI001921354C|nr:excinuclease ABC subunit UvrA [Rhodovulum sulfidophilum]MBL3574029.1 excinuclease ABC subunit UvrA [Rhodovulum sulfidophilum]MCE8433210.1 excinuclease ABC subunit UvrA [Rhodovulum sulfidophilum]MCF4116123.1 excinuclease ABC subunit UvrA [Rhodovulum sulfidophilum]
MTDKPMRILRARTNNLRNLSVEIPKGRIVVFTGVSGSGKSSLLFDTIAAESQRQLAETYPSFVRNRLPHHGQPDADRLENLPASIVVDQRRLGGNRRSTVGTATEIYALLRLLFSRIGKPHVGESSLFSFNNPDGMCPLCQGLGTVRRIDEAALFDRDRTLDEGAILFPGFEPGSWRWKRYALSGFFDTSKPLSAYSDEEWRRLTVEQGTPVTDPKPGWLKSTVYEGVLPRLRRSFLDRDEADNSEAERDALNRVTTSGPCDACGGGRLNPAVLSCRIAGRNIADCAGMEVGDLLEFLRGIDVPEMRPVISSLTEKLESMIDIGLDYLSLDRGTSGLSGGESQRIKMIRHLGSSLADIAYIFDEPSVGLHARDVDHLGQLLVRLRDKGNSVLLVEHDPDLIAIADHVIDMGPGAGTSGGSIVYQGALAGLRQADTPTGRGFRKSRSLNHMPRRPSGWIGVRNQSMFNLHDLSVDIPLGVMTVIAGVAGSGKTTLASRILPGLRSDVVVIDQAELRGSSRSTPASYLGIMDDIRREFARSSRKPVGLFSTNAAGACPVCKGRGTVRTDLAFLDAVEATCEACGGSGYGVEARSVRVAGCSIDQVMGMRAAEARALFRRHGAISDALARLEQVGLAYMQIGQRLSTLSGGERQRLKLAAELGRAGRIYVIDEPTSGLHMADVDRLTGLFRALTGRGITLIVVEHNLDMIAAADHIIEMGPGAGRRGGNIIYQGGPAGLIADSLSVTGPYLARAFGCGPAAAVPSRT